MEWKKSLLLPALLLALASLAAEPPLAAAAEPAPAVAAAMAGSENSAYLIGPGDVLAISVWKDDALSKVVPVLPDGTVSMPLIGQVAAGGSTVAALQKSLVEKVSAYVPDPVLTVQVQQVNSLMVYVVGKANHPGRFVLNGTVNVLQVLAMAGGLTPYAKRNEIKVFREEGGATRIYPFAYDDVESGEGLAQNIKLQRGDIVVVP